MQGALTSARCCSTQVFANTEAGEGDAAPSAPFQPGKLQEWRSHAECRQVACVTLLEPAHFCVLGETHQTLLQEASMTTEYESKFANAPTQEANSFERGESLRIGAESVIVDQVVPTEVRKEACELGVAGKYEPQLRENGIPADVLEKLLPGDDVAELAEPIVAGGLGYRFVKRAFDMCSAGCALIILAISMGIIALKIKSESPGPVIYAQERVGKNGKPFMVYKFRSMYVDAEKRGAQWAQGDDPRVTPFGKVMRKTRLDEIPQFWNVFKGDIPYWSPSGAPGVLRRVREAYPRLALSHHGDPGPFRSGPGDGWLRLASKGESGAWESVPMRRFAIRLEGSFSKPVHRR